MRKLISLVWVVAAATSAGDAPPSGSLARAHESLAMGNPGGIYREIEPLLGSLQQYAAADQAQLHYLMARAASFENDDDRAIHHYAKYLRTKPAGSRKTAVLRALADLYAERRDFHHAALIAERWVAELTDPTPQDLMWVQANHFYARDYAGALKWLNLAIATASARGEEVPDQWLEWRGGLQKELE